jgi:hypothetical protein
MGHINNVPIAYMIKSETDFHYVPHTPSHFLMGSAYNKLEAINKSKISKAAWYNKVCKVLSKFGTSWVAELSTYFVLEERANHDSALSWQRAEADRKKRHAADFPFPYPNIFIHSLTFIPFSYFSSLHCTYPVYKHSASCYGGFADAAILACRTEPFEFDISYN